MELAGRVALVTGAGRRVGRAIATGLGSQSMHVAVHYNGSEAGAKETVADIERAGGIGTLFRADLSLPAAPESLVNDVVATLGAIDVLVNSAAIMQRTPLNAVTPADWDATVAPRRAVNQRLVQPGTAATRRSPSCCDAHWNAW